VHLADGIVSATPLIVALNAAGFVAAGLALSRAARRAGDDVAWVGTLSAFVFVAQTLNVPVLPGTSAHVIGATLLALTLGPARAIVAMSAVLVAQALLLSDGGITVLGINLLNLAVLPVLVVFVCRRLFARRPGNLLISACLGTMLGNLAGAAGLAVALIEGAQAPAFVTLGWLCGVQAVTGLAEGALTAAAVRHLMNRAPALIGNPRAPELPIPLDAAPAMEHTRRGVWMAWLAVIVMLALLPFASHSPDALEALVEQLSMLR
jgi:cobalt/nickel transport system permease protein